MTGPSRCRAFLLFWAGLLCAACFELPPELPEEDGAPPRVQPPPAVYDEDPFAPENRWFQRAFALVDRTGAARPHSGTAEPLPAARELEVVDLAELTALSEAIHSSDRTATAVRPSGCRERLARVILQCDALALRVARASVVSPGEAFTRLDRELRPALDAIAHGQNDPFAADGRPATPAGIGTSCWSEPPPLRVGIWTAVESRLPAGLLPAPDDLRWTMVRWSETRDGSRVSALLRYRVEENGEGRALLLPVPSECWILERSSDKDVVATVWRFDRAASLAGEEPWRRLADDEEFSIRDPLNADGAWRSGTTKSLCLDCHGAGRERPVAALQPATRAAQSERVIEILRRPARISASSE